MEKRGLLALLVLLASLRVAVAGEVDGLCCHWIEGAEWPLEASQCPAALDDPNITYCCGLCYASHPCPFEEVGLDEDECPNQDQLPVTSGSSSNNSHWASAFALIVPGVFLILFFCVWLWIKDHPRGPAGNVGGPSAFVRSQLRARYLPSRYGSCSAGAEPKSMMYTLEPPDSSSLSGASRVRFYQPAEEEDVTLSLEVLPASGGAPEAASGGAPEAASGGAPEAASGGAPEAASGGAPEAASGGAPEAASGGAPEAASPAE